MVPDAWTLAIRYGNTSLLDGPGLIAFDKDGNAWVNNNYFPSSDPTLVCGDDHIFKLTPAGADFPGSPFGGPGENGGLYGSGFGVCVDPDGDVWASSFGFQGSDCHIGPEERALLSQSVSQFTSEGEAISPSRPPELFGGWRSPQADISQPQGTVSDQWGNIWIANCGNASVTKIPRGNPDEAVNFSNIGLDKPFGITIDAKGNAWIAGNGNDSVVAITPDGAPIGQPITGGGINMPMGIAVDSIGNVWISNSGVVRVPCAGDLDSDTLSPEDANAEIPPEGASVTLRRPNGKLQSFKGGGIFIPWGIAVDGNDNIWVANWGGPSSGLVGLSQFCGAKPSTCPPGFKTGDPISPDTGYTSDGLIRVTGVAIDPSGNVWLANNWVIDALENLDNPGGHEVVVFIGLAAPVKTPLLGPPRQP
jgi:streptogramin lyase